MKKMIEYKDVEAKLIRSGGLVWMEFDDGNDEVRIWFKKLEEEGCSCGRRR